MIYQCSSTFFLGDYLKNKIYTETPTIFKEHIIFNEYYKISSNITRCETIIILSIPNISRCKLKSLNLFYDLF